MFSDLTALVYFNMAKLKSSQMTKVTELLPPMLHLLTPKD